MEEEERTGAGEWEYECCASAACSRVTQLLEDSGQGGEGFDEGVQRYESCGAG